jgi:hypothetical protein
MIEILVLIFLTRKIGDIAARKGVPVGRWKLYTVLAWILGEFGGLLLSMAITDNLGMNILFGIVCAVGGYLFVKYRLEQMPDHNENDDWINKIGQEEDLPS